MRLHITSDWHGDWITDGYERTEDVECAVELMLEGIHDEEDFFINLGDISNPFSRGVHRAVAIAADAASTLRYRGVTNIWLVGNHDVVEDKAGSHTLLALKAMGKPCMHENLRETQVFDRPAVWCLPKVNFVALPFTAPTHNYSPEEFINGIEFTAYQKKNPIVVLAHLNIEGITVGSETNDMPRGRDVFLPIDAIKAKWPNALIFNGHYHKRQEFNGVHIPGSLLRLTHGEEENTPGWITVEL